MAFKKIQPDKVQFEVYSSNGTQRSFNHNKFVRDVIYECFEGHETIQTDLPPFKNEDEAIIFGKQRSILNASLCRFLGDSVIINGNHRLDENTKYMCNKPVSYLGLRKKS